MKQHITPSQAKEITEEQFYSLFDDEIVYRKDWADYHYKKITIVKMIEILQDIGITIQDKYNSGWEVTLWKWNGHGNDSFENEELCDTLWEAVKSNFK